MRLNVFVYFLAVPIVAACAIPAAARAQQQPPPSTQLPISPGTRVRVTADNLVTPLIANFLELRGDTLILFEEGAGRGIWSVALGQVQRLEATAGDRGLHRPYIVRGALIGGGTGAIAGLVFASVVKPSDPDREYSRPLTGLVGAAVGAGIGALIGSRFTTEAWMPVPLPRGLSLRAGRAGPFGLTLVF